MKTLVKTAGRKLHIRTILKYVVPCLLIAAVLYFLLGTILPLLRHKSAGEDFRASFNAAECFSQTVGSERVRCLDDNTEALTWRLRLIDSAQEELLFSSFDFRDDESGQDVLSALLDAAERGVQVRVVVDWLTNFTDLARSACFRALVSNPNVEMKVYNPIHLLKPWKLQMRLHDKYIVADDFAYLLGGRNTNDLFLGSYSEKQNYDRDLLVYETVESESGSLGQLKTYFESIWALPCSKDFVYNGSSKRVAKAQRALQARYESLQASYPEAFSELDWTEVTLPTNRITLLTNPIEPHNKEPELWYALQQLMATGEKALIQTPYVICSGAMYDGLTELDAMGTQIELLTNSAESGANPFGCADYMNQKKKLLRTGATVYEFHGDRSSHTKTILVDDRLSIVGSYNLDMRSTYLDTELMLAVDSRELNAQLWENMERDMEQSRHLLADGGYAYGESYDPKPVSFFKRVFYAVVRVVILPIRHLL